MRPAAFTLHLDLGNVAATASESSKRLENKAMSNKTYTLQNLYSTQKLSLLKIFLDWLDIRQVFKYCLRVQSYQIYFMDSFERAI